MLPFVLQIIAAVGLVGLIAYRSGQKAVNDVASQLRTELTNRITQKLDSYTQIPKRINLHNRHSLGLDKFASAAKIDIHL